MEIIDDLWSFIIEVTTKTVVKFVMVDKFWSFGSFVDWFAINKTNFSFTIATISFEVSIDC